MSAELSIVVKIGAAVGGAVGAIRSVVRWGRFVLWCAAWRIWGAAHHCCSVNTMF